MYGKKDDKVDDKNEACFFEKLGPELMERYPQIYKKGILKKAKLRLKNNEIEASFNFLFDGFNVEKLYANFEPKDYKEWKRLQENKSEHVKRSSSAK